MNLHRIKGTSDWVNTAPSKRTPIQKLAALTNGLVTPGNLITLVGFLLVVFGCYALVHEHYLLAASGLAAGRAFDIFDGLAAEATKTKSALGEILDATVDKIGTILAVIALFVSQLTSWWILLLIILPHLIISAIILLKRWQGNKLHPTFIGKISMAIAWVALLGIVIMPLIPLTWRHLFTLAVYAVAMLSAVLGYCAAWQYTAEKD